MKQLALVMTACVAAVFGLLVPVTPASADHVCETGVTQPGIDNYKIWSLYGPAGYVCSYDQTLIRIEGHIERQNTHTGAWVEAATLIREAANARTVYVEVIYACPAQTLNLRTTGRGLAFYHTGFTDISERTSGVATFTCANDGRTVTL